MVSKFTEMSHAPSCEFCGRVVFFAHVYWSVCLRFSVRTSKHLDKPGQDFHQKLLTNIFSVACETMMCSLNRVCTQDVPHIVPYSACTVGDNRNGSMLSTHAWCMCVVAGEKSPHWTQDCEDCTENLLFTETQRAIRVETTAHV